MPEQEALDHEMGLLGHDLTVLEGAGLGLVRIADRVMRGRPPGAATSSHLRPVGNPAPPIPRRPESFTATRISSVVSSPASRRRSDAIALLAQPRRGRSARSGRAASRGAAAAARRSAAASTSSLGLSERRRLLVDRRPPERRHSAPGTTPRAARHPRPRRSARAARRSARRSRAASTTGRGRPRAAPCAADRSGSGVERDQALDLVQRPPHLLRQPHQLLARQPAVLALDRDERRDEAGAGELPGAGLGARRQAARACPRGRPRRPRCPWPSAPLPHRRRLVAGAAAGALDLDGAELELGDLAVGSISSIVSTFAAASRKWNGTKHVPGVSRCERRTLAARSSPRRLVTRTKSPVADAHPLGVVRVEVYVRLGLDRVERVGAARHRAGVPVLEQAAGVEDEGELLVRAAPWPAATRPAPGAPCRHRCRSARRTAQPCRPDAPDPGWDRACPSRQGCRRTARRSWASPTPARRRSRSATRSPSPARCGSRRPG